MIKYFCDRCGQETSEHQVQVAVAMDRGTRGPTPVARHFCDECAQLVWDHLSGLLVEPLKIETPHG